VVIPNPVTVIGDDAFCECSGMTIVDIPSSVTAIGDSAFYGCSSLTSVTMDATTPPTFDISDFDFSDFDRRAFFDNNGTGLKIYVPAASVNVYKKAEGWDEYSEDILPR